MPKHSDTLSFEELRQLTFPPETHIIGNGLFKKGSKLIVTAAPKSYKSFTLNTMISQLLTGGHLFGAFTNHARLRQDIFHISPVNRVLLIEQELGMEDNKERLIPYWESLSDEHKAIIDKRLFIHSCDFDLRLDTELGCSTIEKVVREKQPDVVCFDPLIKFHRQNENDPSIMNTIMCNLSKMSQALDFSTILNHHNNKNAEKQDLDKLRGGSSIAGDLDTCLILDVYNRNSAIIKVETILRRGKPISPYLLQLNKDTLRMEFHSWYKGKREEKTALPESPFVQ
jgi:hypothetical protein